MELHGQELEPSLPLSVYISNPERRKERTDVDANDREVYVAGLSIFVTKEDLENLFKTVCSSVTCFALMLTLPYHLVWADQGGTDGLGQG